jgi:hypothetical protein
MIFACGLSNYHVGVFHLANHAFLHSLTCILRLGMADDSGRLSNHQVIKSLDLRSNRIGDVGLDALLSAIYEGRCMLDHVDLSNNNIHFTHIRNFVSVRRGVICSFVPS